MQKTKAKPKKILRFKGTLEVQVDRGVVYFHDDVNGCTMKLEGIPAPVASPEDKMLEIRLVAAARPLDREVLKMEQKTGILFAYRLSEIP